MPTKNPIESQKVLLKDVFTMWFNIPKYQRPYVWGYDEVHDLLEDITYASIKQSDSEYFMGSFVFQSRPASRNPDQEFDENDLLDGQQRLTTLLLLMAVMRDMSTDSEIKETCQTCIYQKRNTLRNEPERVRLTFDIRDTVQEFIDRFVKTEGGTQNKDEIHRFVVAQKNESVRNMAVAIGVIQKFVDSYAGFDEKRFYRFLLNNVLLIYVSTEDLEDAFRLFTILNDRGVPLRSSDILKAVNLGHLETPQQEVQYAKMWEQTEGELGDDFDRFLHYVRTILVKDKARLSLLKEFEDKIYDPKEKDKASGKMKKPLLKKGVKTFELIKTYRDHYTQIFSGSNREIVCEDFEFDNLIRLMVVSLPSSDWVPPILRYYEKFKTDRLLDFLHAVNKKFAGDWVTQKTPTARMDAMHTIIKTIEAHGSPADVLAADVYTYDSQGFLEIIKGEVYGRRFAKYILLMLDFAYQTHDQKMHFETLSVEHILPQNPKDDSQWIKDFSEAARQEWTHRLGNLVLITRRKNTSQGRLDYSEKKKRYFEKNIDTCPNSLRVLNQPHWTLAEVEDNHAVVLKKLSERFGFDIPTEASL